MLLVPLNMFMDLNNAMLGAVLWLLERQRFELQHHQIGAHLG